MQKLTFIYITASSKREAKHLAKYLLKMRLVACANIFAAESIYWWKSKLTKNKEYVIIAKSVESNFNEIRDEIEKIHSYSVPCIAKINVDANEKFACWLKEQL